MKLILILLLIISIKAADITYTGAQTNIFVPADKVIWYFGQEKSDTLKLEIKTNSVEGAECFSGSLHWRLIHHTRVMQYTYDGKTNEIKLAFLGTESRFITNLPPTCNCSCCNKLRDDIPIKTENYPGIKLGWIHLTNQLSETTITNRLMTNIFYP